jgi:hypothetical protein
LQKKKGLKFVALPETPAMPDNKKKKKTDKDPALPPDPETLHTTDPQEKMKGPVSSFMQDIKQETEKNNAESKDEANQKKEDNM